MKHKFTVKLVSAVICAAVAVSGFISSSAEADLEYTPIASQSIMHGLIPKMCGISTDGYSFTAWTGVYNMVHLTDGIIARKGVRDEVVASNCPINSQNGASYYFVYDLEAYYDITSVAVWAKLSRGQHYIDSWDVYASETIRNLFDDSSRYTGLESGSEEYDKQIGTLYRRVRYLAFAVRHNNADDLNLRVNEFEAFGKKSVDQSEKEKSKQVSLSADNENIKATAGIEWVYSNQEASEPDELIVKIGKAEDRRLATETLGYYYSVYEAFDVSLLSGGTETKNGDMNKKFLITVTVPERLRAIKNLQLAAIYDGYAETVCTELSGNAFTFEAANLGSFAFVVPNYSQNATLYVTEDFYPLG